jgi:hypothetical protein
MPLSCFFLQTSTVGAMMIQVALHNHNHSLNKTFITQFAEMFCNPSIFMEPKKSKIITVSVIPFFQCFNKIG